MSEKNNYNNYRAAIEIQHKFWFYFLALTFTILGLSIQTAETGSFLIADIFEICSWFFLLISGVAGLSRLEWIPNFFYLSGKKIDQEKMLRDFQMRYPRMTSTIRIQETNEDVSVESFLENRKESINILKGEIKKIESKTKVKYYLQRSSFLIGIVLLILSRSYSFFDKLFCLK